MTTEPWFTRQREKTRRSEANHRYCSANATRSVAFHATNTLGSTPQGLESEWPLTCRKLGAKGNTTNSTHTSFLDCTSTVVLGTGRDDSAGALSTATTLVWASITGGTPGGLSSKGDCYPWNRQRETIAWFGAWSLARYEIDAPLQTRTDISDVPLHRTARTRRRSSRAWPSHELPGTLCFLGGTLRAYVSSILYGPHLQPVNQSTCVTTDSKLQAAPLVHRASHPCYIIVAFTDQRRCVRLTP